MANVDRRDFLKTVSAGIAAGAAAGGAGVLATSANQPLFAEPMKREELKNPNPKSLLMRGKYVVTNRAENVIADGAVYSEGGKIVDVGTFEELSKKYKPEQTLGSDKHILMPGLVNAHHHAEGLTYPQSGAPDDFLEYWLKCYWWKKGSKEEPIDLGDTALLSYIKNLESGVTTIVQNDWYMGQDKQMEAANKIGIRASFALAVVNAPGRFTYAPDKDFYETLPEDLQDIVDAIPPWPETTGETATWLKDNYLNAFKEWYAKYSKGRVKIMFGPFGVQWVSKDLLDAVKEKMKELKIGFQVHLLETRFQKAYAQKYLKKSAVEYLKEAGLLGPTLSCAHCVWTTEKDLDLIAEAGTTIVTNPSSNLRLQSGIAPVNAMVAKKINVALGMDGLSLADDEDMFAEMRLCKRLHQMPGTGKPTLAAADIIRMATVNGAKGAYLDDKIGILDKDYQADMILVDLDDVRGIYMADTMDILDAVIYRAKGDHVRTAVVGGEILMHERNLTKVNKKEIEAKIVKQAEKPWDKISMKRRKNLGRLREHFIKFYDEMSKGLKDEPFYGYNSRT